MPDNSFSTGSIIYQVGSAGRDQPHTASPDWRTLFSKYPPEVYQEIWIEASRGCPRKKHGRGCSFCSLIPNHGSCDWRPLPPDRVIDDIRTLADYGVGHVRFADDEFMAGQTLDALALATRLKRLNQELRRAGCQMPTFDFAIRVDDVCKRGDSEDVPCHDVNGVPTSNNQLRSWALSAFKEAGLIQVYLGLESGSSAQLRRMAKAITPDDNRTAIGLLRDLGIRIAAGWILMDPLMDDVTELKESIAFLEDNALIRFGIDDDFVTNPINRMRVVEGSPIVRCLREKGLLGERKGNLIEHEFSYGDARFALMNDVLTQWDAEIQPLMYALKTKVGAELLKGAARSDPLPAYMATLKQLDFKLAKALLEHLEKNGLTGSAGTGLDDLTSRFRDARRGVLEPLYDDVQKGVVDDANGTLKSGFAQLGLDRRRQARGPMKRILITGGAGFVGCNLARHLTDHGFEVVAVDDLSFGRGTNLPEHVPLRVGNVAAEDVWKGIDGRQDETFGRSLNPRRSTLTDKPITDVTVAGGGLGGDTAR